MSSVVIVNLQHGGAKMAEISEKSTCCFFSLLEQLGVDESDDILKDLECRANQKIRPKGSDEGT